jgi:hypothetical protein
VNACPNCAPLRSKIDELERGRQELYRVAKRRRMKLRELGFFEEDAAGTPRREPDAYSLERTLIVLRAQLASLRSVIRQYDGWHLLHDGRLREDGYTPPAVVLPPINEQSLMSLALAEIEKEMEAAEAAAADT